MGEIKFSDYRKLVEELASKLPQWNTTDTKRRFQSSIYSLLEEAGEISGCISKYRIRKDNWDKEPKELDNYEEARNKFIDELSDFLWVLVCSMSRDFGLVSDEEFVSIFIKAKKDSIIECISEDHFCIETNLVTLFDTIILQHDSIKDGITVTSVDKQYKSIVYWFGYLLACFDSQYNITLTDLMEYNMQKLRVRYDKNGQRTDGK